MPHDGDVNEWIKKFMMGDENKTPESTDSWDAMAKLVGDLIRSFRRQGFNDVDSVFITMKLLEVFGKIAGGPNHGN